MKILKLTLNSAYKNLNGVYDFSSNDGYIAIIGLNGSGKSNLLEAISLIFNGIFNKKRIPFDYEIEYKINGIKYYRATRNAKKNDVKIKESEMQYPSSVIACYSGEDLRLWRNAYKSYHMNYFKKAIDNSFFAPRLLYVNKYCWSIALIALLALDDNEYVKNILNISNLENVLITFYVDVDKYTSFKNHDAVKWFNRFILKDKTEQTIGLNELISYDILSDNKIISQQPKSRTIFQFLYLLSQPQKNKINKVDKLITNIDIKIGNVYLNNLSEGEKKIILIECITKVLADKESLILLDEPNAHVHISREKELLKVINNFDGQTIFTTHSPVFLNLEDVKPKNIFYINNGKQEEKNSLDKIRALSDGMNYFDGVMLLNSKKILMTEGVYDKRYLTKAIHVFSHKDEKYNRLKDNIIIFPAGSSGNVYAMYKEVLESHINNYEKIVCIFDYDKGGYDGWEKTKEIKDPKVLSMFYQENYNKDNSPSNKNNIDNSDTVLIEDLFSSESYKEEKNKIDLEFTKKETCKELRNGNKINGSNRIKDYIEKNYDSFKDIWYDPFQPVLDKLLDVFFK